MMINYPFNKNAVIILVSFLFALTPVNSFSFQLDKGSIDYDVLFKEGLKRSGKILNLSGKKIGDRGIEHLVSSKYLGKVEKIDEKNKNSCEVPFSLSRVVDNNNSQKSREFSHLYLFCD